MTTDLRSGVADWDTMVPSASEDRLLLLEHTHRVANEVASALAALHLVRSASGPKLRWRLLGSAIERLEGFAAVNRVLAVAGGRVPLDVELDRLCNGLGAARRSAKGSRISLDLAAVEVDGETARLVLMIAAELILNAIRHALEGRDGKLVVVLRRVDGDVALSIIDDGPGMAAASPSSGTGMGGPLVRELVRRADGWIDCESGPDGTTFSVAVPVAGRRGA